MLVEVRWLSLAKGEGSVLAQGETHHKKTFRDTRMFYILIWMMKSQMYTYAKIHQAVHLRFVYISVLSYNNHNKKVRIHEKIGNSLILKLKIKFYFKI